MLTDFFRMMKVVWWKLYIISVSALKDNIKRRYGCCWMTSSEINMSHILAKWAVAPVQKNTRFYFEILSSTFTRPLFFLSVILQWSSSQLEPHSRLDHKHNMTLHNDDTVFVTQQYCNHMRFQWSAVDYDADAAVFLSNFRWNVFSSRTFLYGESIAQLSFMLL